MMTVDQRLLAYAAGIIDGEGYIHAKKLLVRVVNTEVEILEPLVEAFDGTLRGPYGPYAKGRKLIYVWSVYGSTAKRVLELVVPFMRSPARIERARRLLGGVDCK